MPGRGCPALAVQTFPHNDVASALHHLQQRDTTSNALLLTETVFSMDGDLAPLDELAQAARRDRRVDDDR